MHRDADGRFAKSMISCENSTFPPNGKHGNRSRARGWPEVGRKCAGLTGEGEAAAQVVSTPRRSAVRLPDRQRSTGKSALLHQKAWCDQAPRRAWQQLLPVSPWACFMRRLQHLSPGRWRRGMDGVEHPLSPCRSVIPGKGEQCVLSKCPPPALSSPPGSFLLAWQFLG